MSRPRAYVEYVWKIRPAASLKKTLTPGHVRHHGMMRDLAHGWFLSRCSASWSVLGALSCSSSTNIFRRPSAASHCCAIWSRERRASSSRFVSSVQMRSRPRRLSWTRPASARMCRCLVIDCGPPAPRRSSSANGVASPSAAKSGAASAGSRVPLLRRDIAGDVRELLRPALVIHAEGDGTARQRDAFEAGLDHRELRAVGDVGELKLDQCGRLAGVVHTGLNGVGMPAVGQQVLRFNPLNRDLQGQVLMTRSGEATREARARREVTLQCQAEPGAELLRLREGAPDPRTWRVQDDGLLDAIHAHMQPPDCIIPHLAVKCNRLIARQAGT